MVAAIQSAAFAQGIIYVVPQDTIVYGPVTLSNKLDLNGDGITDFILSSDISGAWLTSQSGNFLITGPGGLVPVSPGSIISSNGSSLDPIYQWSGGTATLGGQAVFDGEYFYSGNFSDTNAFIGLQFQFGGQTHYGWMEIYNYPNVASGQVLGWAYESDPNTPIEAGAVPEPSIFTLFSLCALMFGLACRGRILPTD
jgi:hypothetical protein